MSWFKSAGLGTRAWWRTSMSILRGDNMAEKVLTEFRGEAVSAIEQISKITGRHTAFEVLSDALRTYLWILREQASGHKVISVEAKPEDLAKLNEALGRFDQTVVANLIVDRDVANAYFSPPPNS